MPGFVAESREIGGKTFTVKKLSFGKGQPLLVKLLAAAGPVLAKATGDRTQAMALLGSSLSNELIDECANTLGAVSSVKIDSVEFPSLEKSGIRDSVFDGDYLSFFEWLAFALEVQYRDFFLGLLARAGQSQPAASG